MPFREHPTVQRALFLALLEKLPRPYVSIAKYRLSTLEGYASDHSITIEHMTEVVGSQIVTACPVAEVCTFKVYWDTSGDNHVGGNNELVFFRLAGYAGGKLAQGLFKGLVGLVD